MNLPFVPFCISCTLGVMGLTLYSLVSSRVTDLPSASQSPLNAAGLPVNTRLPSESVPTVTSSGDSAPVVASNNEVAGTNSNASNSPDTAPNTTSTTAASSPTPVPVRTVLDQPMTLPISQNTSNLAQVTPQPQVTPSPYEPVNQSAPFQQQQNLARASNNGPLRQIISQHRQLHK